MPATRTSRVISISLPPELAERAELLARQESRTVSELFREALRVYQAQDVHRLLREIGQYADSRNTPFTESDVPRLIRETRAELPARHNSRSKR